MSVTIIVGGQYGSEGKGKIAAYLSGEFDWAVKSGGPNSGHTVYKGNREYKLRTIPSAFVNENCKLAVAPAAIVSVPTLLKEIQMCEISDDRLLIDRMATIIEDRFINSEKNIVNLIGSTGQGVGAALIEKLRRSANISFAKDIDALSPYLSNVSDVLNSEIKAKKKVLVEGSQGFGLSIVHGEYPYVTSRETTSGTLCSDTGVGILSVKNIILVIRTFPIRVGGNSGPLKSEIDWGTVTSISKSPAALEEFTTVTNRLRRVGKFDVEMVKKAAILNSATSIAVNFVDYLNYENFGINSFDGLSKEAKDFIISLEDTLDLPVTLIGTGPKNEHIIDLRKSL